MPSQLVDPSRARSWIVYAAGSHFISQYRFAMGVIIADSAGGASHSPLPDVLRDLLAHPLFLLAELRRERVAEILRLEDLPDLDLGLTLQRVRAFLDPVDRLLQRVHFEDPEAGEQLLGLGERTIDHGATGAREPHTRTLRRGMEPLTGEHDASLDQLLVVLAHVGQQLLVRQGTALRRLVGLQQNHESHHIVSLSQSLSLRTRRRRRALS